MLPRYRLLLTAAVGVAAVSTASPAQAVALFQDTAHVNFNITGSQTSATPNTSSLIFNAFSASAPSTLTSVELKFVNSSFGGTAALVVFSSGTGTFSGTAGPTFSFSGGNGTTSGTSTAFTLTPNSVTNPADVSINAPVSGSYTGLTSALSASNSTLQAYFAGTPTIDSYYANWSIVGAPSGITASNITNATLGGQVYLRYGYTAPDPVPGPLPILGAGAAFGFSRKLRQRIRSSAS